MSAKRLFGWKNLVGFLLLLVLVSALLESVSVYLGYKRYFISVEVFLAFLVASTGYVWLGLIIFVAAIFCEIVLGLSTVLFLFDISQIFTISRFIFEARFSFILIFLALFAGALTIYFFAERRVKRLGWKMVLTILSVIIFLQSFISFRDGNFFLPSLASRDSLIAGSALYFADQVMKENGELYNLRSHDNVDYIPINHLSAMMQSIEPKYNSDSISNRVVFVLAESWGKPKNEKILHDQIRSIEHHRNVMDFTLGTVKANGATAFGEFRELCGKIPTKLNLKKISESSIGECWPKKLANKGYQTVSLHGAHGTMYDRLNWYPVLGINKMIFREILPPAPGGDCHSFPGYCDRNLFNVARNELNANKKIFLYWLTLNSHMPYDKRDVVNYRENICDSVFIEGYDEKLCNYQNLHTQFFEEISELVSDKSMTGVEFVIVGDHPPPLLINSSVWSYFEKDEVPFIHFKVK